jgi:hypothetical protein
MDAKKIRTVYDVSLVAGGANNSVPATLTSAICGRETEANMYIRKFDLEDIPKVTGIRTQEYFCITTLLAVSSSRTRT